MARTRAPSGAFLPPPWHTRNTHLVLWHGTVLTAAHDIETNGIDPARSRPDLDFGAGFYTTTRRFQAARWAQLKHGNLPPGARATTRPALLQFRVPLGRLAALDSLLFVRGDAGHDAFWSFVYHCRSGTPAAPRRHLHPTRPAPNDWYDVVCGPLAATWPPNGRTAFPDSDQFSFHTAAGAAILEDAIDTGAPDFEITAL